MSHWGMSTYGHLFLLPYPLKNLHLVLLTEKKASVNKDKNSSIYEYNKKYLEGCLITWTFSKMVIVSSLIVPMTFTTMGFWSGLYQA